MGVADIQFGWSVDMEFKQRQPEVEKSQVTMALKLGQGIYGEVSVRACV